MASCVDEVISPCNLNTFIHLLWAIDCAFQELGTSDCFTFNVYLARAEHRYWRWLSLLHALVKAGKSSVSMPPFDVLIIWLAHLQSPYNYAEDVTRLFGKELLSVKVPFDLIQLALAKGRDYVDPTSKSAWELHTENKEPFVLSTAPLDGQLPAWVHASFSYICPFCAHSLVLSPERFLQLRTPGSKGLACAVCNRQLNAATVSCKRLAEDIIMFQSRRIVLAGTLINRCTGQFARVNSETECDYIGRHPSIPTLLTVIQDTPLSPAANPWNIVNQFLGKIIPSSNTSAKILQSLVSCYQDNISPFSTNLFQCVKTLRDIHHDILYTIGWRTEALTQSILNRAPIRYHQFVQLMELEVTKENGKGKRSLIRLLPTLEIDLCIHFHMCFPLRFREYYMNRIGRVYDHEDVTNQEQMSEQLAFTGSLWLSYFGTSYYAGTPFDTTPALVEHKKWPTLKRFASLLSLTKFNSSTNNNNTSTTTDTTTTRKHLLGVTVSPSLSRKLSNLSISHASSPQNTRQTTYSLDLPRRRIPEQFLKARLFEEPQVHLSTNHDTSDTASKCSSSSSNSSKLSRMSKRSLNMLRLNIWPLSSKRMPIPPMIPCASPQSNRHHIPHTPSHLHTEITTISTINEVLPEIAPAAASPNTINGNDEEYLLSPLQECSSTTTTITTTTTAVATDTLSTIDEPNIISDDIVFEASAIVRPLRASRTLINPQFIVG